jgi:molecular chaperone DnaK
MQLQKTKEIVHNYLGEEVERVYLTIPTYFNEVQRQLLSQCAKNVGFQVVGMMSEPAAACVAYGLNRYVDKTRIAVYDFGGRTFDISILELSDNKFKTVGSSGDNDCGGDNIDQIIVDYIVEQFKKESGIDITNEQVSIQRVREAAEKTKTELSKMYQSEINLPFLAADRTGPKHYATTMSRSQLESLTSKLFKRTLDCCDEALEMAGLKKEDIDEVVLVGGTTRVPRV